MRNKPTTHGDVRQLIAESIWEVRYGHLEKEKLAVMAIGLDSINTSLRSEIAAWALMVQLGKAQNHELGELPMNSEKAMKTLEADAAHHLNELPA